MRWLKEQYDVTYTVDTYSFDFTDPFYKHTIFKRVCIVRKNYRILSTSYYHLPTTNFLDIIVIACKDNDVSIR